MNNYPCRLDPSSKKFVCPNCGKKKFVKYISTATNEYLPEKYGKCDRATCIQLEQNNPYKNGFFNHNKNISISYDVNSAKQLNKKKVVKFIPEPHLVKLEKQYNLSSFYKNLITNVNHPFTPEKLNPVFEFYRLGAIKSKTYMNGALAIPYINISQKITAIQVKDFDKHNHTSKTNFYHSMLKHYYKKTNKEQPQWLRAYLKTESKVNSLFGEHQLKYFKNNPVAIFESPKTAIYSSLYFGLPEKSKDILWLATFNIYGIKEENLKVLEGRDIILFPDLSKKNIAFKMWSNKAEELEKKLNNTTIRVYNYLEKIAKQDEKNKGFDLGDFLIEKDWKDFKWFKNELNTCSSKSICSYKESDWVSQKEKESKIKYFSEDEVHELKNFFKNCNLNSNTFQLNEGEKILDINQMVSTHLEIIKSGEEKGALPYFNRLKKLMSKLMN